MKKKFEKTTHNKKMARNAFSANLFVLNNNFFEFFFTVDIN